MNLSLFTILGAVLIFIGVLGLLTGKVMAGSKGLKTNYYSRAENPVLYYAFTFVYIVIGTIVITKSI